MITIKGGIVVKRKLLVSMIFMIALIYTTGGMVNASGETEKNDWLSLGKEQYNAARTLFTKKEILTEQNRH